MNEHQQPQADWKAQRRKGMGVIAVGLAVAVAIWVAVIAFGPRIEGADNLSVRMLFALKCLALATLFCFVGGIEAVAHERLQSAAFDPLQNYETRRIKVNLRYLQNTLEQLIVFAVGLFGLAAYMTDGSHMRAVLATTVVWIIGRYAFWIGYHRSAAMRGAGAASMLVSMLMLLYVAWRIGNDVAGVAGGLAIIIAFLALEAALFRSTGSRSRA